MGTKMFVMLGLALFVVCSGTSANHHKSHPGTCPAPRKGGILCGMRQCRTDQNCGQNRKCCNTSCEGGFECRDPVKLERPGSCPSKGWHFPWASVCSSGGIATASSDCGTDSDCHSLKMKCCPTPCGTRVCVRVKQDKKPSAAGENSVIKDNSVLN